jgi:glutamate synthase (NADPH/NADH) large chain
MSGGVAYVYKLRADHINHDSLAAGELKLLKLSTDDKSRLKGLLEAHLAHTDSKLANELLLSFEEVSEDFTVVVPRDYANVLEIRTKAISDGEDPDSPAVWSRILEVTNG